MKYTYSFMVSSLLSVSTLLSMNGPNQAAPLVVATQIALERMRNSGDGHKFVAQQRLNRSESERALKMQQQKDLAKRLPGDVAPIEPNTIHSVNEPLRTSLSPRSGRKLSQTAMKNVFPPQEEESGSSASGSPQEKPRRNTIAE